jgi:hypothetical protein
VRTSTTRRLLVRGLSIIAVVVIGFLATACSSDSKPAANTGSSSASTASNAPAVIKTTNAPRTTGYVGARVDVTNLTCEQQGNTWKVGGTVTNPTAAPVDYRIFTSFLDDAHDTKGLLQTDVKAVAANEARTWTGELEIPASGLQCILRVERTDAGAP